MSATPVWSLTTKGARLAGAAGGLAAGVLDVERVALGLPGAAADAVTAAAAAAAAATAAAAAMFAADAAAAGALLGDGAEGLALPGSPSSNCLGAKREGRTDVLNFRASAGLLPALSPAVDVLPARSSWLLPDPAAAPTTPCRLSPGSSPSRELVRGISPLSSVLMLVSMPGCRRPDAPAGLWLPPACCLLVTAKGEAAVGSAMCWKGDPGCCREQPESDAEVAAAAAAAAAAIASGGRGAANAPTAAAFGVVAGEAAAPFCACCVEDADALAAAAGAALILPRVSAPCAPAAAWAAAAVAAATIA